ncbi:MAG: 4,5-DOPA dioxygenase extradiol [Puia sp.]|nr:4,5-DOPA dioxygenase extradiol [Puia sp.]
MPTIFFGHGNPMLTLSENVYTKGWNHAGRLLPRPKAVLAVSAHWYGRGLSVTSNPRPSTIHDFYGFPEELFAIQYGAPGSLELASRVKELLTPEKVALDDKRGLDHGTWSVLRHVFQRADVPIVQLSMDAGRPPEFHYEMGKRLAPLRQEGVLVVGSGNIIHNLSMYSWNARGPLAYDWAERFEQRVRELLAVRDDATLTAYQSLGRDAELSIPTPEHYLPLLYVLGSSDQGEALSFPVEGMDGGSMSMLAVQVG